MDVDVPAEEDVPGRVEVEGEVFHEGFRGGSERVDRRGAVEGAETEGCSTWEDDGYTDRVEIWRGECGVGNKGN